MPIGGQVKPSSTVGERDESQKAQKNETKKNTSDRMNSSMPIRSDDSSL